MPNHTASSILAWLLLAPVLAAQTVRAPDYKDASLPTEQRVQDLLGRMTLEEKVAQLQGVLIRDPKAFDASGAFIGGADAPALVNGAWSVFAIAGGGGRFMSSPRDGLLKANAIQQYMVGKTRLGIPVTSIAEALHGLMSEGATSFPQAIALGSTWDLSLVEQVFAVAGAEAAAHGRRQVLGPVLDLARDPRWGRFEECYSEDPYLASRMGMAAVYGLQGRSAGVDPQHVLVTLKHFAGHGQSEGGRNMAPLEFSDREFISDHLYPFEMAIKVAHAHALMASYNEWDGVPNHVNHRLLTDILRTQWGFDGEVMSDGNGIEKVYQDNLAAAGADEAGIMAIEAGVDVSLGGRPGCFTHLAEEERAGKVSMASIDRAASDVLRLKFLSGVFEHPFTDPEQVVAATHTAAARALSRRAGDEAMVLLKNDNHVLPLDPSRIKSLAVIGPDAAEVHLGGYSAVPMEGVSVLQGVKDFAGGSFKVLYAEGCKLTVNHASGWLVNENPVLNDAADDARMIDEAVDTALKSDAVVLVIGENELLRREAWSEDHLGDRDTLELVGRQNELATALIATGKPLVVLLINGGPLSINRLQDKAQAIVECWYLGDETGHAVADVLFGAVSPSGKLTVTFPRSVGQIPDFYDHMPARFRNYVLADSTPLYPFGFGLSYHDLRLQEPAPQLRPGSPPGGSAQVSVDVTNSGRAKADEIVELYVHALVSMPTRPVEELKDFARVTLNPGQTRTVTFALTPDKLESFNLAMVRTVEPGDFEILVGRSSVDVLKARLRVEAPKS